jgi:hypothetical protein
MATGYNAIFENVFALLASSALVPDVLGPVTNSNLRLYRAWPQFQSLLTTYEPNQPSEGWLVIEEDMPGLKAAMEQYGTDHDWIELTFHVYGTTYAVTHEACDVTDRLFHWTVPQQRDLGLWGEKYLLFTRRVQNQDKYQADVKLFEKTLLYRMEFVRAVQLQP